MLWAAIQFWGKAAAVVNGRENCMIEFFFNNGVAAAKNEVRSQCDGTSLGLYALPSAVFVAQCLEIIRLLGWRQEASQCSLALP
jgi:hypothetical protein